MLTALLIPVGVVALLAAYLSPHLERKLAERRLAAHCRATGSVVLSFDDGPGARLTPKLLDLLHETGAPATFFALGRQVAGNESLLDRIVAEGHELGCHGHDHPNAWKSPPGLGVSDIRRGYQSLRAWLADDGLFRPPYGKMTLPSRRELWRRGAAIGCWTLVSGDTFDPRRAPAAVANELRRAGGGVVLLHDFDDDAPERDDWVLETTRSLIQASRDAGLRLRTLGDVMRGMSS